MPKLELLISEKEIQGKVKEVGKILDQNYQDEHLTIIMIMKGAICLVADLIRNLHMPCSLEFIQASSYKGTVNPGELNLYGVDQLEITGKNVLVVDDIIDSGVTFFHVVEEIRKKHPKSLKSLALLSKLARRKTDYVPDFILFEIEDHFVVGYGLDYNELYRGLPDISILNLDN